MKSVLPCLVVFLLALLAANANAAEHQPNFVFIIADDCTFRDLGCYGGQAHTPNIDRLATQGMRFTRCFQAAPMCSPTRHNIYTGLYPVRSGAYPNHTYAVDGTKSIVHYLQPLGYRVALSGKTHIGPKTVFPFEYSVRDKNPSMPAIDRLLKECGESDQPFCLFACSNEPHTPWNRGDASRYPPEQIKLPPYIVDTPEVREGYSRYLAEITYYDDQVGQILNLLEKHDAVEDTVVMVVSEQGNSMPFAKWTCYSNGVQSAMVVRWPGQVEAGSETNAMVEYTDITPTFVDIAGGSTDGKVDGRSFRDVLLGKTDRHKTYSYSLMTTRGVINGSDAYAIRSVIGPKYRLVWNLHYDTKFTNACTKSKEFLSMVELAEKGDSGAKELVARYHFRPEFELFDVNSDPLEMKNLAGNPKYAADLARLRTELNHWMDEQGDQGKQTEIEAILHQGRYRGKTFDEALKAYQKRTK